MQHQEDAKVAIAAPSFDAPSETFIRDHVRTIAPGRTALICLSGTAGGGLALPAIEGVQPSWRTAASWPARLASLVERHGAACFGPEIHGEKRRRLLAFLSEARPAVVLAEYGPTGCFLAGACREAAIPLFVHFHGYDASRLLRKWWWRRNYRHLFDAAAGIIAPSNFLAGKLREAGCPGEKLHVNPCGVDAGLFAESTRKPQQLVAVGRLVEKKAPQNTILAFARIAERFPGARLDIVGDGELAAACEKLVARLGLAGRVRLHGKRDPGFVADVLSSASIFAQHSVTAADGDCEGMPVAVLEAMSCALPVVSTRHSGIADAVQDGITGLLVAEHDVDGMADAIASLLEDPARAEAMGKAGRRRVLDNFTQRRARDRLRAVMGLPQLCDEAVPAGLA